MKYDKDWLAAFYRETLPPGRYFGNPSLTLRTKTIQKYVKLKNPLGVDDRVWFFKLFLSLLVTETIDLDVSSLLAEICEKIIRKEDNLPSDAMIIEWRPIYTFLNKSIFPRQKDPVPPKIQYIYYNDRKLLPPIIKLVGSCRRFFRPESSAEIIKEIVPKLNPHNLAEMVAHVSLLCGFLSTDWSVAHSGEQFQWISLVFSLWDMVTNVPVYDSIFIELFSRLYQVVKNNLRTKSTQMKWLF